MIRLRRFEEAATAAPADLVTAVRALVRPLESTIDLDPLLHRIGDARLVLLGEATHGTHEFYAWRAALSRRLIDEEGFSFVAVEGDWPDCYRVNRFHRPREGAAFTAPPTRPRLGMRGALDVHGGHRPQREDADLRREGVAHAWLVDPIAHAGGLDARCWQALG